jgi:hypothetical protein
MADIMMTMERMSILMMMRRKRRWRVEMKVRIYEFLCIYMYVNTYE